jgi:hypothetical protein
MTSGDSWTLRPVCLQYNVSSDLRHKGVVQAAAAINDNHQTTNDNSLGQNGTIPST